MVTERGNLDIVSNGENQITRPVSVKHKQGTVTGIPKRHTTSFLMNVLSKMTECKVCTSNTLWA